MVQLEPYTSPERPEENEVALRILKIIEPVQDPVKDYRGPILRPIEGTLLQRRPLRRDITTIVSTSLNARGMKNAAMLPVNFEDLP